jgi:hypothetical protein
MFKLLENTRQRFRRNFPKIDYGVANHFAERKSRDLKALPIGVFNDTAGTGQDDGAGNGFQIDLSHGSFHRRVHLNALPCLPCDKGYKTADHDILKAIFSIDSILKDSQGKGAHGRGNGSSDRFPRIG